VGRRRGILLVVAAALVLAGCGGISRDELDEEVQARGGGLGETLPLEALAELEEELGEPPIVSGMYISLNSVSIEALVPGTDNELDDWIFNSGGLVTGPTPVTGVAPAEELRRTLMDPSRLAIDELDEIVDDALAEADLEDGYAQNISINRTRPDLITIAVTVANERDTARIEYRGNGDRIEAPA
jgi:hypothetical protein